MEFSEFTKSLFTKTQAGSALSLPEPQLDNVASYIVQNSVIGFLGTNLTLADVNTSSASFLKNIGQTFKDKTKPGDGDYEEAKLDLVTFNWLKPKQQSVAFTKADLELGIPNTAAIKLQKAAADYSTEFESYCWGELEKKLKTKTSLKTVKDLLAEATKPQDVYQAIVNQATALTRYKSDKDGINGIKKSDIIIFVKPEILDKVAMAGLAGNNAEQMFVGGQYSVATIGGYKIVANQFLSELDVIVTTNFAAASMTNINAANIGNLGNSNDIAMYFEAMSLFGIVYDEAFKYIKKTA